jgi:hypothetical protein
MKKLIVVAGFALAASAAHAQCPYARAAAAAANASAHTTSASGGPGFVPSTFVGYSEALTTGEEQLKAKSGIAEAARTAQAAKISSTERPALVAQQDDAGNMVISKPRQTRLNPSAKPNGPGTLTAVNRQAQ